MRYKPGTGKRPFQSKKKAQKTKPAQSQAPTAVIEQAKAAETADRSVDTTIERIKAKIVEETKANLKDQAPAPAAIDQTPADPPGEVEVIDNWRPPGKDEIDNYRGLASLPLTAVDYGYVYYFKTEDAKIDPEVRDKAEGVVAELMAMYMPDQTAMTKKQFHTYLLIGGLIDAVSKHHMRVTALTPAKVEKKPHEPADNQSR